MYLVGDINQGEILLFHINSLFDTSYVVRCAIWYRLYNLNNVKNTPGGALILLYLTLLHGCFSRFLNCTNGTKLRNAPLISMV